jgi:hypothetical protein
MSQDPAFLFYPGDYLRDTQCLSEKAQVSYDRVMCEHMRNISEDINNIAISQDKLNFFTKRLSDEERDELLHVLHKINGCYQIKWVAESICKRKSYSNSRAKNRSHKNKQDMITHDEDMDNENAIENNILTNLPNNKVKQYTRDEKFSKNGNGRTNGASGKYDPFARLGNPKPETKQN